MNRYCRTRRGRRASSQPEFRAGNLPLTGGCYVNILSNPVKPASLRCVCADIVLRFFHSGHEEVGIARIRVAEAVERFQMPSEALHGCDIAAIVDELDELLTGYAGPLVWLDQVMRTCKNARGVMALLGEALAKGALAPFEDVPILFFPSPAGTASESSISALVAQYRRVLGAESVEGTPFMILSARSGWESPIHRTTTQEAYRGLEPRRAASPKYESRHQA